MGSDWSLPITIKSMPRPLPGWIPNGQGPVGRRVAPSGIGRLGCGLAQEAIPQAHGGVAPRKRGRQCRMADAGGNPSGTCFREAWSLTGSDDEEWVPRKITHNPIYAVRQGWTHPGLSKTPVR